MNKEKRYEYGCVVCKHRASCKPNPFGICKNFEMENAGDDKSEKCIVCGEPIPEGRQVCRKCMLKGGE